MVGAAGVTSGTGASSGSRPPSRCVQINANRLPTDEQLGFDAAVAALGLKANVSEAQHPLICEGIRRQKGDLAIALLLQYKDDQYKLDKVGTAHINILTCKHFYAFIYDFMYYAELKISPIRMLYGFE